MKKWRRRGLALVVVGLVLAGVYGGRAPLLSAAARWLDVGQPVRPADYAVVLPGGENTRPFAAAALVKAGLADHVLVTKNVASPQVEDGIQPPIHEIICRVLRQRGVPEDEITVLEGETSSTFGDMEALAGFLESEGHCRVLIITDHYHTRRARWVATRVLKDRVGQVSFVSAPVDGFRPDSWWRRDVGFTRIVGEYLKLAYYIVRYGTFLHWAIPCAIVLIGAVIYRRFRNRARSDSSSPRQATVRPAVIY